jgi:hypothetical protein
MLYQAPPNLLFELYLCVRVICQHPLSGARVIMLVKMQRPTLTMHAAENTPMKFPPHDLTAEVRIHTQVITPMSVEVASTMSPWW